MTLYSSPFNEYGENIYVDWEYLLSHINDLNSFIDDDGDPVLEPDPALHY